MCKLLILSLMLCITNVARADFDSTYEKQKEESRENFHKALEEQHERTRKLVEDMGGYNETYTDRNGKVETKHCTKNSFGNINCSPY